MSLNLELAKKVLDYAENEPEGFHFDMGTWFNPNAYWEEDTGSNVCGTSACLAGTAVMLHPEMKIVCGVAMMDDLAIPSWVTAGAKALGIDDWRIAHDLFLNNHNRAAIIKLKDMIKEAVIEEAYRMNIVHNNWLAKCAEVEAIKAANRAAHKARNNPVPKPVKVKVEHLTREQALVTERILETA